MTWQPTDGWLLELPPPLSVAMASVFAGLGVRRLDPTMQSGRVLVPVWAVAAIQAALSKRPNVPAVWSWAEGVEFANARSQCAFDAALKASRTSVSLPSDDAIRYR